MYRLLLFVLLTSSLAAQVTATKSQVTVTGTTGAMVCTATAITPIVTLKCVNGAETTTATLPISVSANAATLTFNVPGGAQTWQFTLPSAAGPIAYAVTATPAAGCPALPAVCTSSGTF